MWLPVRRWLGVTMTVTQENPGFLCWDHSALFLPPNHAFPSPSGHAAGVENHAASWRCGKNIAAQTLLVWSVSLSSNSSLALGKQWNPALHWVNFIPTGTCEHLTPSRGRRYCGNGLFLLIPLHCLQINPSHSQEGPLENTTLHSLLSHTPDSPSPHRPAFLPLPSLPHLKHNYSFHQPLFICVLPPRSCLFLGSRIVSRKGKKPHYFIRDFSVKSELKWEFFHGTSWGWYLSFIHSCAFHFFSKTHKFIRRDN